jgi:hypothetical protein
MTASETGTSRYGIPFSGKLKSTCSWVGARRGSALKSIEQSRFRRLTYDMSIDWLGLVAGKLQTKLNKRVFTWLHRMSPSFHR